MVAYATICVTFCLVLALSQGQETDVNNILLKRFEELKARHASEIAALKQRVEHTERTCDEKVTALERRVKELEDKNGQLEEAILQHKVKTIPTKSRSILRDENLRPQTELPSSPRRSLINEMQIAFTAYLDHNVDNIGTNQVLLFNHVLLNDGQGYNNFTGTFTAPTSGVYSFSFHIGERHTNEYRAYLVVNGKHQIDAVVDTAHDLQDLQGGNTANLRLDQGDAVYVTNHGGVTHVEGNDALRITSFSGFLIYPVETPSIVGK